MARIYDFPGVKKASAAAPAPAPAAPVVPADRFKKVLAAISRGTWTATVLLWPVLRWVVSIDVFIRLLVMLYHWDTPGTHAGCTFLLHAAVLVALTYYVSAYRPKGIER